MAAEITCSTNDLGKSIENAQEYLNKITSGIDSLYDSAMTLDGMWSGPAHDAFATQFYGDQKDMKEMCDTIQALLDCMRFARKEYDDCELQVGTLINSIRVD